MQNKSIKNFDFPGHNVYVGRDVHSASRAVNIRIDQIEHRSFTQPPDPIALYNYLTGHFPGANYYRTYECGFSGYHHHRKLLQLGNIVINSADLPCTDKGKTNKCDPDTVFITIPSSETWICSLYLNLRKRSKTGKAYGNNVRAYGSAYRL